MRLSRSKNCQYQNMNKINRGMYVEMIPKTYLTFLCRMKTGIAQFTYVFIFFNKKKSIKPFD